ncbi:MAG: prolyl oligopeptidase family serine peptidase, partial [Anaerolineae bacterium]|nr:prolyl oligopeptidase family serine peptidase [Anaerolineae bacterium]
MPEPISAPYGAWKSPITPDLIVEGTVGLSAVSLDGDDVYWIEARPTEAGRNVIVRRTPDGRTTDLTPMPFNARTRVHEYGGGEYLVHNGTVYFANFADQRLYRQEAGAAPQPITPAGAWRYADAVMDARRGRLICVREDHTPADREAINALVAVACTGDAAGGQVLVSGNDFYASPRLSPDGSRLAWLTWNHPNMPWDGCELWVAAVQADGSLADARCVAGGPTESIFQPTWSPTGVLYFVSDRTGWWNLYRWQEGRVEPLCEMAAEFGRPQWVFGLSTYAFVAPDRLVCAYTQNGIWRLALLDTTTKALTPFDLPYTEIGDERGGPGRAFLIAASPTEAPAIVSCDVTTRAITILRRSSTVTVDAGYLSVPQPIAFPTGDGLTAHALYYPPTNRDYRAPEGERPPLLVLSHGGPTGATSSALRLSIQFWTSRGFAVVDVNYGGSTGYGRAYRERLNGRWGIVDVDDCVNAARALVARGLADEKRLAIRGGSAGGYTTLAALTFRNVFRAGASHFGVSDLEALATDTHKFESRYLDRLVGPYPERRDLYIAR